MEFEFIVGSLEAAGLQEGDEVECTYSDSDKFTTGHMYYVENIGSGSLYVMNDKGMRASAMLVHSVKFKPHKMNVAPPTYGDELKCILRHCKEGDLLECVDEAETTYFTTKRRYRVKAYAVFLCIENDDGDLTKDSSALFVFAASQATEEEQEEHDIWGIGKTYTAPKKEYEPDTNVDGHKAFDLIKGIIR